MPNSPHNSSSNTDSLCIYLKSVLPESRLTDVAVDSAYQPLLLLQTDHLVAAFAISNGDMH